MGTHSRRSAFTAHVDAWWRAYALVAIAGLVVAGLLSAVTSLSMHMRHSAALSAAVSSARASTEALTHSPRLLRELAGPATPGTATPRAAAVAPGPQGVDVASYQHSNGATIDWGTVAQNGYKFAAVKATEGDYYTNPYFAGDIAGASAAGLYAMAYHFAIPDSTTSTASQQADYLIAAANGTVGGATPQLELDVEYNPYGATCYGMTASQLVSWIAAFSTEIRLKTGQLPIIYTTADWWGTCTAGSTAFSASHLWVAQYGVASPTLPAGWPTWTFWQYTSTGSVPGIVGNVDVSYFNDSAGTLANPGPRTGTTGAPVWLQIHALVGSSGYSATGLPRGLSINASTGLISGWLTTPGTYTASVTATTPLATTGTTGTFTWTVGAAPNAGPTGRVVLAYGGKCLDDPGYRTANGTRVDLWTCTGGGNQQWTLAQDRTVRIYGKCLDVYHAGTANGTAVDLYSCNGTGAQQWRIGVDGWLVNPGSGKCLTDPAYRIANGTLVNLWSCTSGTNQRWTAPAGPVVSQIAPMCADDAAGSTTNGNPIDVQPCSGGASQAWTVKPDGTLRVYGKCLDVYHAGTVNGSRVDLYGCNGTGAQQWQPRADGTLLNPQSGRCLDDPGDSAQNGTKLVIFDCGTAAGEDWRIR